MDHIETVTTPPRLRLPPISKSSPTAKENQDLDPEVFLNNLVPYISERIVTEWREARKQPGIPRAQKGSIDTYYRHTLMLESRYAAEMGIDLEDLNPIETVRRFFYSATRLSPAAWKIYRYGLLYVLNDRAEMLARQNHPHKSTLQALAALITFPKKPYSDERAPQEKRVRVKTVRSAHYEQLMRELYMGRTAKKKSVARTRAFAAATLATGLRPSEWDGAELRPARQEEVPAGTDPAGWMALVVNTTKRKDYEAQWVRTIILEPGIHQIIIQEHMNLRNKFISESTEQDAGSRYTRRCSTSLSSACAALWPAKPERWITLYTLRSQARANIASQFGAFVAAAMLGHSVAKSQRFYGGMQLANLPRGGKNKSGLTPVPFPGPDCLAMAQEMQRRQASGEPMPELNAPEEGEEL